VAKKRVLQVITRSDWAGGQKVFPSKGVFNYSTFTLRALRTTSYERNLREIHLIEELTDKSRVMVVNTFVFCCRLIEICGLFD